ncbi:MAG: LysM peptidoglycan-binding domain-containing M23 family metallopeptidase [Candidatus Omnitrophota bacterium]
MPCLKFYIFSIIVVIALLFSAGCSVRAPIIKTTLKKPPGLIAPQVTGEYHSVKKGETLWKISQYYSVDLNQLSEINRISNTCKIEVGQEIFIPDYLRKKQKDQKIYNLSGKITFIWPYKGEIVSCFNQSKLNVKNPGIDLAAKEGSSIAAACDGIVIFTSENMRGYGKAIIIQHAENFTTVYTQNKKNLVKKGEYVKKGQVIAKAGSTGRTSRCLVHFELRKNNKPQNPLLYLP